MNDQRDRPIGELLRDLSAETGTLVRQEVALARVEIEEKVERLGKAAGFFGGAAILGLGAFGAITACLIAALAIVLQVWAAALIVAVVYGIVAYLLVRNAQTKIKEATPLVPQQTAETVKEDIAWAKMRAKSGAK